MADGSISRSMTIISPGKDVERSCARCSFIDAQSDSVHDDPCRPTPDEP